MEHILDIDKQKTQLNEIFKQIQDSNTILFLGAGASVGEKRYLSKEIIEYYESDIGKKIGEANITKFIDILSADVSFSRSHFDQFTIKLLQKLQLTEAHKILATIPWREIITTNYDLLIERAYDEIAQTSEKIFDLKPIRSAKQYSYRESNTEIKYIKLHGCIQDPSLYKLAFSTDDFSKLKTFYRSVLNDLKNLSPAISFLSIGYSFSDEFGRQFLERFDSFNYREKRWMINVDPFPNENALAYYTKNKICIVKLSFQDFFRLYKDWDDNNKSSLVKKKGLSFRSNDGYYMSLPHHLLLNLEGVVKQLDNQSRDHGFIKEVDFYMGEEPTFNLITRNVDVVKLKTLNKCERSISETLSSHDKTFIPIFFITGDFGIGKSTLALRLIYELERQEESDLLAFEITDFNRIKRECLVDLIKLTKSQNIILFCDEVEVESTFKSLLEVQRELSIEQFQDKNLFFIVPIRENILERYKLTRDIPSNYKIKIDGALEPNEIDELLEKLKTAGLVDFRDALEKKILTRKIQKEYGSDTFISLMSIITNGKHENDLVSSYQQLSSDAQKAFLHTALIHRHKLLMPASWLKENIDMDWDQFTTKVIKAEGKGILIQEVKASHGTQPDLLFRTKHPLIAAKLVDRLVPSKDTQYEMYKRMLKHIDTGQTNSYLVNNLLKAFVRSEEFSERQINLLFDTAYSKLSEDPYFLLNYAINLQGRRTKSSLKKAFELLVFAESLLDYRNHKFIHRRGVINFELAKIYFDEETVLNQTIYYLNEAKDLFLTKQLLDPFSAYSYVDYIKLLIWELEHFELSDEESLQRQIQISELLDLGSKTVTVNIERIDAVHQNYATYLSKACEQLDYVEYLKDLYSKSRTRPYACILLYNYYERIEGDELHLDLLEEMEGYQDNFEIVRFLFKFYGRRLYDPAYRIKYQRLNRENPKLEKDNPLRFNYYNFMAESYNHLFYEGKKYLSNIQGKYHSINPEFNQTWKDEHGDTLCFIAQIVQNDRDKVKAIKIPNIQLTCRLVKGNYSKYKAGDVVTVKLHFYLYGIMAEIVGTLTDHING